MKCLLSLQVITLTFFPNFIKLSLDKAWPLFSRALKGLLYNLGTFPASLQKNGIINNLRCVELSHNMLDKIESISGFNEIFPIFFDDLVDLFLYFLASPFKDELQDSTA